MEEAVEVFNKINNANGRGEVDEAVVKAEVINYHFLLLFLHTFSFFQAKRIIEESEEKRANYITAMVRQAPGYFQVQAAAMHFCWFIVAFIAYGVLLNWDKLGGDLFINMTITS